MAALGAAALAYIAAGRGAKRQEEQAREDRWWDQAKWASEQIATENQPSVDMGLAALEHLANNPPSDAAGAFIRALTGPIAESDEVDAESMFDGYSNDSSQEVRDDDN